jgi:hypothetical protein
MTKSLQCCYPPVSPCPPSPPLSPFSRVCICVSVVLNSWPHALLPPPLFSLFSSLPSLFRPSSLHVTFVFTFAFVAPSSPPLPLFPLACHVCICIRGGMLSSLPSLAPLLAYTTASLSPAPCSCSRLAPLWSPHCALFAFMTLLMIVLTFMTGPLLFAFTTMPMFACCTGPRCPHLRPHCRILVRYVIGTPIHPLSHPCSHPCSCPALVHDTHAHIGCPPHVCIHSLSHSHSWSLALAFMVPRAHFHSDMLAASLHGEMCLPALLGHSYLVTLIFPI